MKNVIKMSLATAIMMSVGTVSAQAADEGINVLSDVKFQGELRPRYQFTDNDATTNSSGSTFTNRTNLNISGKLLEVDGLKATVELNAVNDFNTLDQNNKDLAAEADVAKMSQAKLEYGVNGANLTVGRSTTNLDNQRFIGSVGWKQNFQTLDLVSAAYKNESLNLFAAYVYGVNDIGDDGNGEQGIYYGINEGTGAIIAGGGTDSGATNTALLNGSYKLMDELKVTAYSYMVGSVSDTYGIALTGDTKAGDIGISYRAEYAMQADASLEVKDYGKADRDSEYYNLDLGLNFDGILAGINYEVLGAGKEGGLNGETAGFQTPFATKHKFNGWADKFLVTPTAGLVDTNVMLGYKAKDFGVAKVIYHTFEADRGSTDYGDELDLIYINKIPGFNGITGMLKAAFYSGESEAVGFGSDLEKDTTKFWAMLDYKFSI